MVLQEVFEGSFVIEERDEHARSDLGPSCARQAIGGLAHELLDAAMLGPVDGARPSRVAELVTMRQQMSLLEVDVLEQALLVFLEQPLRLRPPAVHQGLLVPRKEIAKGKMVSQE